MEQAGLTLVLAFALTWFEVTLETAQSKNISSKSIWTPKERVNHRKKNFWKCVRKRLWLRSRMKISDGQGLCRCPGSGQRRETMLMSEGHDASRVILVWVACATTGAIVTPGLNCCQKPCLSPWCCYSWVLCWCPRSMLWQGFIGLMPVQIQLSCLCCSHQLRQQESWSLQSGKIAPTPTTVMHLT